MKRYTHYFLLSILSSTFLLGGCKVGPNYQVPDIKPPAIWQSSKSDEKAQIDQEWWKHFHDPVLDQLVAKANAGNWNLKAAEARIKEARAARATAVNGLLPTVNTDASFERQGNRIAFPPFPGFSLTKPFDVYQAGFDATWELDLFGGTRRQIEAASAELQASEASRDDARVSLLAEVARTYVDIRQYQEQLKLAQDTIDAESKTASIAQERFKAGEAPGLDVTQTEAQVAQAKAQLPFYSSLLVQAEFSMDVLIGEQPGATQKLITSTGPVPVGDKSLVLAAPARIIANRPDIREAERKLASATAQQGSAVAQFFPDISLSGFLGLLNTQSSELLHSVSKSWDFGGSVIWPILNYGKLSANLHAADARQQEALAQYQQTVLSALSDVERSVTAYSKEDEHRMALEDTAAKDAHAVDIARQRYKEGLSSLIEVLDAERTLYAAQSQATSARAATSENLISVYKSLGGGWQQPPATAPSVPAKAKS